MKAYTPNFAPMSDSWLEPNDDEFHFEDCDGDCDYQCTNDHETDLAEARMGAEW